MTVGKTLAGAAAAVATVAVAVAATQGAPRVACVFRGGLPDISCTPGATNPAATQATLKTTVCKSGWTATIRPPLATTEPQKRKSMTAYGLPRSTSMTGYEYDHLISLELGGAPDDSRNLWPEPHTANVAGHDEGSYVKDRLENRLKKLVCNGTVKLADAQTAIAANWVTAYKRWVGPLPVAK